VHTYILITRTYRVGGAVSEICMRVCSSQWPLWLCSARPMRTRRKLGVYFGLQPPASLTVICISNCINSHRSSAGLHDSRLNLMLARISDHGLVYSQRRQRQADAQKGRRRINCSKLIAISSQIHSDMLYLTCIYGVRIAAAAKIAFAVLPTNSPARVRLPAATASVSPGYVTGA